MASMIVAAPPEMGQPNNYRTTMNLRIRFDVQSGKAELLLENSDRSVINLSYFLSPESQEKLLETIKNVEHAAQSLHR